MEWGELHTCQQVDCDWVNIQRDQAASVFDQEVTKARDWLESCELETPGWNMDWKTWPKWILACFAGLPTGPIIPLDENIVDLAMEAWFHAITEMEKDYYVYISFSTPYI